jgi:Domain of unknown function (DUF5025)
MKTLRVCLFLLLACGLVNCKHGETARAKLPINSFSMLVNGQLWTPYQNPKDICSSTFGGRYWELVTSDVIPIYTLEARRDPNGINDAYSENTLRLQVKGVYGPGVYVINGTYKEDFDSYVVFYAKQSPNNYKKYVNDPRRKPFTVDVGEIIPIKEFVAAKGIKGTFSGVLYNEADPSDSLRIDMGEFTFNIVNVGSDKQCGL